MPSIFWFVKVLAKLNHVAERQRTGSTDAGTLWGTSELSRLASKELDRMYGFYKSHKKSE